MKLPSIEFSGKFYYHPKLSQLKIMQQAKITKE